MYKVGFQIYLAWVGKYQKNLTEFSWWHLWPYILFSLYIHVCTGSTDMHHISPYPILVGVRMSPNSN